MITIAYILYFMLTIAYILDYVLTIAYSSVRFPHSEMSTWTGPEEFILAHIALDNLEAWKARK